MAEQYTEEELKSKTRVQLRRLAVSTYGMDNKECSNTKSEELIAFILDRQEGGDGGQSDPPKRDNPAGEKSAKKSGGRGLARRPRGRKDKKDEKKDTKKESKGNGKSRSRSRKAKEPEPDPVPSDVDLTEVTERIDALGGALDEGNTEAKELLEGISEGLDDIKRNQFIQWGLLCDIYSGENADADLDARLDELEEEWEKGQQEGND